MGNLTFELISIMIQSHYGSYQVVRDHSIAICERNDEVIILVLPDNYKKETLYYNSFDLFNNTQSAFKGIVCDLFILTLEQIIVFTRAKIQITIRK